MLRIRTVVVIRCRCCTPTHWLLFFVCVEDDKDANERSVFGAKTRDVALSLSPESARDGDGVKCRKCTLCVYGTSTSSSERAHVVEH